MNREIILGKNLQELTPQGDIEFPFNLMHITLSHYPFYNFPCHWHPELEMTYVLEGEMTYMVNQASLHLKEKDCILVMQENSTRTATVSIFVSYSTRS